MASTIKIKNSSTASAVPTSSDLVQGELAVNVTDKRIFTENASGTVVELGINPSSLTLANGTANGVAYLNGSKVVTSGSALTFDGTNLALTSGYFSLNGNGYIRTDISGYLAMQAGSTGFVWRSTGNSSDWMNLSSGNLGLGVTPSAWNSAYKAVQVGAASTYSGHASVALSKIFTNAYLNSGGAYKYITTDYASMYEQYQGAHNWSTAASGTAGGTITFTQAMTLDASGNLGVGTTSSSTRLTLKADGSYGSAIIMQNSAGTQATRLGPEAASTNVDTGLYSGGYFRVYVNGNTSTAAAMVDSSGNLLVGTTSALGTAARIAGLFDEQAAIGMTLKSSNATTGGSYQYFLNSSGSLAGSISHTGSTTVAFNTSSDERLKEDKGVATDTSVIDNTIIHDFEWKVDNKIDRGVFAQEAYEVKPSAVSVGSDELTEDGNLAKPWSVDYSKYVPDLIVYCQQLKKQAQEQQAIIIQLQADVAALKA